MMKTVVGVTTNKPGPKPKYATEEERRIAKLEANKRYRLSSKGKIQKKKDDLKYILTDNGKKSKRKSQKKYINTDKGKAVYKRYWQSEKGRILLSLYWQSLKGRAISRKNAAERRSLIRSQKIKDFYVEEIKNIYSECPFGYEVDHILPIKHEDMCGLHVPWNMQYLPISVNRSKSNKILSDCNR